MEWRLRHKHFYTFHLLIELYCELHFVIEISSSSPKTTHNSKSDQHAVLFSQQRLSTLWHKDQVLKKWNPSLWSFWMNDYLKSITSKKCNEIVIFSTRHRGMKETSVSKWYFWMLHKEWEFSFQCFCFYFSLQLDSLKLLTSFSIIHCCNILTISKKEVQIRKKDHNSNCETIQTWDFIIFSPT